MAVARVIPIVFLMLSLVSASPSLAGQQSASSFTEAQATAGRAAYTQSCAECHGPDLGGGFGPPLVGSPRLTSTSSRTEAQATAGRAAYTQSCGRVSWS